MDDAHEARLFKEACELIDGLILLDGRPEQRLSAVDRGRLERALPMFQQVVHLDPDHWPAFWFMGKINQRLGAFESGLECFVAAHRINPDHTDVAREASIAAMDAGQPERAVGFCERAIAAKPTDAGLRANLALALLFSGRASEAAEVADDSLRRSPSDEITARIAAVSREVVSGARSCPRHVGDLE